MQSVSQPIPRCVLAQSYLESIDRTNTNNNNSATQHTHGGGLVLLDDRNSDLDEQYQQLVHLNGAQSRHNNSNSQHYQQDGIVQLKQQHYLQQERVYCGRTTAEKEDDRLQKYNASREHNLLRVAASTKSTSPSSTLSLSLSSAVVAGANQNQHPSSLVPPPFLQVSPQHQQQLNQRHFQHNGGASGAYEHPTRHSHHTQHHHLHRNQIQHNHNHHQQQHQQRYSRADMSRLEAMFPPLHDSVEDSSSSSTTPFSKTLPAAEAFMSALDQGTQGIQRPSSHVGLAASPKPIRPQRLVPPPILIPKDIMQQNKQVVAAPTMAQNQNQQHLPSPVPSATSPESPSSLAIHLYVHHHHHHHSQESSSSSAVVLQDGTTGSSSSGSASLSPSNGSAPMVLLSPLTFPHSSMDHPLYQQQHQQHLHGTTKSTATASLPSPPLSNPEIELSQLPSPPPVQLVSLLPPLSIPSANNNSKTSNALLTPPTSARSPPLIVTSATKSDTTPINDDTTSSLPWFNHPNSLANTATKNQSNNSHYQQRRHRQQNRNHQPRPRLPDPALASQLLSTISSKDLARLYVHAAHHLHSHQPIRRYVMMKMIMTQAELAQYGRLRAEMPRAPGPSTGAQPKRNGFGSPAQSGFEFRPKRSSRLGRYMFSAAAFVPVPAPAARWGTAASGRSWGDEEDMVMEVWNEKAVVTKKKSTSLPWTQSLSSLVSLTKRKSTPSSSTSSSSSSPKPTSSVSEPNLYCSSRRLEELELGHDHPRRANTVLQPQQSGNRSSSSSRIRRRVIGGERMYSEDDYDDDEGSEDTETGDDFEGEEDDGFDDEELDEEQEEEEEKPSTYWSMLRTRSNNNQPRKRDRRNSSVTDQHHNEARIHLSMQQQDKEHNQYYQQQQQQQQQQKIISLQQLDPQVIIYTSSTKPNTSSTTNKSKSSARRRTALNHTNDNNGSLVPSSSSPYSSPNSSSSSSHFPNGTILSTGSGSAAASFTETYGASGLLMLALFFVFLFLLEGTNQFYKIQSALLSIIL